MSNINSKSELKEAINSLLSDNIVFTEIEKHINNIHKYFESITSISGFDHELQHLAAVPLSKGKALGLNHAAQCLLDYNRTIKFLKAMVNAIKVKQEQLPGQVIKVFYAGCGPYAPFISLIAPLFEASEIQFTLLEINKISMESTKRLLTGLELNDFVDECHIADAITFKVPNAEAYHILFSETLDALLYRESYVPILYNLLPQFSANITLLPNNVIINATLLATNAQITEGKDLFLGEIFNTRKTLNMYKEEQELPSICAEQAFSFEEIEVNNYASLLIDTLVHVEGDIWLQRNESSLTLPYELILQKPLVHNKIQFSYHLEPDIELKYHFE